MYETRRVKKKGRAWGLFASFFTKTGHSYQISVLEEKKICMTLCIWAACVRMRKVNGKTSGSKGLFWGKAMETNGRWKTDFQTPKNLSGGQSLCMNNPLSLFLLSLIDNASNMTLSAVVKQAAANTTKTTGSRLRLRKAPLVLVSFCPFIEFPPLGDTLLFWSMNHQ